ncbi:hypothetical protein RCC89_14205 [Cytophagaceae bacterium ABcell3]|nr:hypothetical protein RCC89_14205 [Cytophagaceae bacterium ABcell3]
MNESLIKNIVDSIFNLSKNESAYLGAINEPFILDSSIIDLLQECKFNYTINDDRSFPKVSVKVFLGDYSQGGTKIDYYCFLEFSKLFRDVVHVYFRYIINNPDVDRLSGILTDDVYEPLTVKQYDFYENLKDVFKNLNIQILSYNEVYYVLCNMQVGKAGLGFFGHQPTLGLLLFNDYFDLCPD